MAFQSNDLSVLAYANGFTLWHYTSPDAATDVDTAGYFNEATDMVRVGDMIIANTDTDGTPANGMFVITSNSGSSVNISDLSAFGAANAD